MERMQENIAIVATYFSALQTLLPIKVFHPRN